MTPQGAPSPALPRDSRGAVITVGTFDGVHRGHRAVLEKIVRRSVRSGRRSVLVTFDPHPLRIVRPENAPQLLTTPEEKKEILAETGLEYAVFLRFTEQLRQLSARRFVEEILLGRLGMEELVVGYDHGFGRGREGGVETMRALGAELGFGVDVVEAIPMSEGRADATEHALSSTRIRRLLEQGDVVAAARGLGRPYSLSGPVVRGEQRGRQLGFPTANIAVTNSDKLVPRAGVYAVYGWIGGVGIPGLLHLGPRPTFKASPPSVELHLLDWSGELYDRTAGVDFCARLRDVRQFPSVDELVQQLRRDEAAARELFGGEKEGQACVDATHGLF